MEINLKKWQADMLNELLEQIHLNFLTLIERKSRILQLGSNIERCTVRVKQKGLYELETA